jgi:hypothetical protein
MTPQNTSSRQTDVTLGHAFRNPAFSTIERSSRDLLLSVVRDSATAGDLRALANCIGNWDDLIDLALQHRVLPMLLSRLAEMAPAVSAGALNRIQEENDRIVVRNLANAAELIAILQTFDRHGIQAIPFKGVVLAAFAYGGLLSRPGGDLDFLVRRGDLACATERLQERGYELETSTLPDGTPEEASCYEYKFQRQADGMVVELRWRLNLTGDRYGRDLGLDWVWPSHAKAMLAGTAVPVLSPEVSLLVLCMHGCKHYWSRLVWVCDVAKMVAAAPELDWRVVLTESKRLGLKRSLGLGVLISERMLQTKVPKTVLDQFESDKTTRKLAEHFVENLLREPGIGPRGRMPYGIQLLDFHDRSRLFLSPHFLRPSVRDRDVLGLPEWLRPLYFLLRPIRLLLDRSAR